MLDDDRREPERGLVDEQQARIRHQPAADRQHLLFAAGQIGSGLRAPLLEDREHPIHALDRPWPAAAAKGADLEIFLDRQTWEDLPALGNHGDAEVEQRVRRSSADGLPEKLDGAPRYG